MQDVQPQCRRFQFGISHLLVLVTASSLVFSFAATVPQVFLALLVVIGVFVVTYLLTIAFAMTTFGIVVAVCEIVVRITSICRRMCRRDERPPASENPL